ncbi:MAG: hypothetical protein A2X05_07745 [Bacteroidetes bacterium GWE2_41_25]|nr:MAG: hypothetical protein A2X03_04210 [Bacteroidetes bacterium GWA2_40_15]OFY00440.1 MAG: hypothetical protein A2X05_07745 [Bacteroidetes bacterium GWE2_41_25]HBH83106.1 hypothetical protein [Bacteroidales bacterium]HBQ84278.1 hypothetical protein [Bacteroidales bacterium]HCU20353.1 hypothetical protein [Bacteroidales bacterium]
MLKNKPVYLLIAILFSVNISNGQTAATTVSEELGRLYGRLAKDLNDSVKIQVNDSIRSIIEVYMGSDTVFNHRFGNLRYLGQVTSPDSLIKIVSWNLVLTGKPGRYYSYIIRKQDDGVPNLIYRLTAEYNDNKIRTDTTYYADNWYGALYYDIRPNILNEGNSWVLLGIDYGNLMITRKIIDILSFTQDNKIQFGMNLFSTTEIIKQRDVFEYSSTATMSLRFAGDGSIVFDHLVPFSPELTGDRQYYGPHFSTDAYIPEKGLWINKLNVDARNKE